MRVNGIIAEYNPFHNGHKYQLEESLRLTDADFTVVVMSGNFVQRGAPALLEKRIRTEMALRCGADLVLELHPLYATASAEYFAAGAVALLDKLGVITHLCFGSECGDAEVLQEIGGILLDESEEYSAALKYFLQQGFSYPNARAMALIQRHPFLSAHKKLLCAPNNILGIEYCKAIRRRHSGMAPVTVKRVGSGYHDREIPGRQCSALAIRQALFEGADLSGLRRYMPEDAGRLIFSHLAENTPVRSNDFSEVLYYKLLSERDRGYEKYLDVSGDLSNRILNRLNEFTDFEGFCVLLKTKEMTYTRLSRCLLHILLGIEKQHMESGREQDDAPYAKVLGFRRDSASLLGAIKERSSIPLVTKLADAEELLESNAYRMLRQDIDISELYRGVTAARAGKAAGSELSSPIVIV